MAAAGRQPSNRPIAAGAAATVAAAAEAACPAEPRPPRESQEPCWATLWLEPVHDPACRAECHLLEPVIPIVIPGRARLEVNSLSGLCDGIVNVLHDDGLDSQRRLPASMMLRGERVQCHPERSRCAMESSSSALPSEQSQHEEAHVLHVALLMPHFMGRDGYVVCCARAWCGTRCAAAASPAAPRACGTLAFRNLRLGCYRTHAHAYGYRVMG